MSAAEFKEGNVKRWCGRAAAGTETAAMNPMVEWHGDPDEDTPYVLASDYDVLLRCFSDATEEAHRMETALKETCVEMAGVADERDRLRVYVEQLVSALRELVRVSEAGLPDEQGDLYDFQCEALDRARIALANNLTGSAKAAGAPGAESTATPTNTSPEINHARPAKNPGYMIVPIEPTEKMLAAGSAAADGYGTPWTRTANAYDGSRRAGRARSR